VLKIKDLYTKPSPHRAARQATLDPLAARARDLRTAHATIVAAYADDAHDASTIDQRQAARYLRPELVLTVASLVKSARTLTEAGSTDDLAAALRHARGQLDNTQDRTWEAAVQQVTKITERVATSVAALRRAADEFDRAKAALTDVELANVSVIVPPMVSESWLPS
jgi:hypothetical protein